MNLGDLVKDRITGFTGIIVARTEWLNRCVRCSVQPQALHEGKPIESQYFDIEQLELVESDKVVVSKAARARATGGDRPAPRDGRREERR